MVGGYAITQPAVYLPPNNYSYSDTGMFLDDDGTVHEKTLFVR
jgi:hypothetical protein